MAKTVRVLLIEDHPGHAVAAKTRLTKAFGDGNVELVSSLQDALDAIRERPFDALASDWDLGYGETAEPAIQLFRSLRPEAPCVVFSAHTDVRSRALAAGADGFLTKSGVTMPDLATELLRARGGNS